MKIIRGRSVVSTFPLNQSACCFLKAKDLSLHVSVMCAYVFRYKTRRHFRFQSFEWTWLRIEQVL